MKAITPKRNSLSTVQKSFEAADAEESKRSLISTDAYLNSILNGVEKKY